MWARYKKSKPLPVEGGIKLGSKKNSLPNRWWKNRWIEAIESFEDAGRLSRGRSYAKKGQVLDIIISDGKIVAKVQGSRNKPYRVVIEMQRLSSQGWSLVIEALGEKALYTARLLSGELPNEIEEIFEEINTPLLPSYYGDFSTDCTCPDWSNPCKHVAAVLYLLGDEFGRDPFLLFKAKGMDRETFLNRLEEHAHGSHDTSQCFSKETTPLPEGEEFWEAKEIPKNWLEGGIFTHNSPNGAILKSLGKFPFWRGTKDLFTFLEPVYVQAASRALQIINERIPD